MKKILLLIALALPALAWSQFPPKTFTSKASGVLLMGQSNSDRFFTYSSAAFERRLDSIWTDVDTTIMIPVVKGGTYLAETAGVNDWNPNSDGELYDSIVIRANGIYKASPLGRWEPEWNGVKTGTGHKALSEFRRNSNMIVDFRLVVWIQGENDAFFDPTAAAAYETNLTAFIAGVREKFNKPNLPFVVVGMGGCYVAADKTTVNNAMIAVAAADSYVEYINISDLDCTFYHADQVHYAHSGASGTAGFEVARRIKNIVNTNGW